MDFYGIVFEGSNFCVKTSGLVFDVYFFGAQFCTGWWQLKHFHVHPEPWGRLDSHFDELALYFYQLGLFFHHPSRSLRYSSLGVEVFFTEYGSDWTSYRHRTGWGFR